ncbi:MAG: sensor histidine kinase [Methylococcaceae bacterium]|nr:sensor histidine kinase [Methylococcaceae bacterium]
MHFSTVLTAEVERDLKIEALSMMQEIDWHLFERIQNIMIWKNLEIMQDIRVQDIDKRLAAFLQEMNTGYQGMYQFLLAVDQNQQFIAASDRRFNTTIPNIHTSSWQTTHINDQALYIQTGNTESRAFSLAVKIPDQFRQGGLGYLHAAVEWDNIYRILESPLPFLQNENNSYALLVDQNNTIIAASQALRNTGLLFSQLPADWNLAKTEQGIQQINRPFLNHQDWMVVWASSTGHRSYKGLGWKVIVMHPLDNALEPVWQMRHILLSFLAFTTLLAIVVSLWTAHRIAQPIIQLARFTREFMLNKETQPPTIKASGEIAELSKQFTLMISSLEQSQQDRVRMAKFAVIAEMAATMAHEIRTPLGILRSSAQMLGREKNLSPIATEMIGFISSETTRLNQLVTSLLESSCPRETHFSRRAFTPVIEHTIELLRTQAERKYIVITLDNHCTDDQLNYDWDQMLQVFLNLIMNAIQHMQVNGRINISTSLANNKLIIQVADDGSGISDAQKESIFEPFYTSRKEGIGLGLTVVQQIISTHQGTIKISDSHWGGACFTLSLPLNNKD